MPNSFFPAVISFADKKKTAPFVSAEYGYKDHEDFGARMADAVEVQEIDTHLYMSKELWLPKGARAAFGGQIVAQALRAAYYTVSDEFDIHALQCQFVLGCSVDVPVLYHVQNLLDGRSYANRYVIATQKNKPIFVCSLSFSKQDNFINLSHQTPMPAVPEPEEVVSDSVKYLKELERKDISPSYRFGLEISLEENTFLDFRQIDIPKPTIKQRHWVKTRGSLADDRKIHACVIAYTSDMNFINATTGANGITPLDVSMLSSLNHSMWFHSHARADEWLLYDVESPRTESGRGFVYGKFYTRDGTLAVTTAQEGVVRLPKEEQNRRKKTEKQSKM